MFLPLIDSYIKKLQVPTVITNNILAFSEELSDQTPFFLEYQPEGWSRELSCDLNVDHYIQLIGSGTPLYGYRIWAADDVYIECDSHVIWTSGESTPSYRDVSFCTSGESRVLFLPVHSTFTGGFDSLKKKHRKAFNKRIRRELEEYEMLVKSLVRYEHMSPEEAWATMQTYDQWKRSAT